MPDFVEYLVLTSSDGLLDAKITYKEAVDGRKNFSFAILRRIQVSQDGSAIQGHTHWLFKKHIAMMRLLLDEVEERLRDEEEKAKARK